MRILGISLWPEKFSNEQYIERVRKNVRIGRRARYLIAAIGLCVLVMAIFLAVLMATFLNDIVQMAGRLHENQSGVWTYYSLGIVMGFYAGFLLYTGIVHVVEGFAFYRKDKLLIECWDALSDAERARLRQMSS